MSIKNKFNKIQGPIISTRVNPNIITSSITIINICSAILHFLGKCTTQLFFTSIATDTNDYSGFLRFIKIFKFFLTSTINYHSTSMKFNFNNSSTFGSKICMEIIFFLFHSSTCVFCRGIQRKEGFFVFVDTLFGAVVFNIINETWIRDRVHKKYFWFIQRKTLNNPTFTINRIYIPSLTTISSDTCRTSFFISSSLQLKSFIPSTTSCYVLWVFKAVSV